MRVPTSYTKKAASDAEIADQVNAAEDYFDVAEILAATNEPDYNLLKLGEELAELQEVVMKTYIKSQDKKPSDEKLVEELGDVIFRILVFAEMRGEDFNNAIESRLSEKANKLLGYYNEGKYIGGL